MCCTATLSSGIVLRYLTPEPAWPWRIDLLGFGLLLEPAVETLRAHDFIGPLLPTTEQAGLWNFDLAGGVGHCHRNPSVRGSSSPNSIRITMPFPRTITPGDNSYTRCMMMELSRCSIGKVWLRRKDKHSPDRKVKVIIDQPPISGASAINANASHIPHPMTARHSMQAMAKLAKVKLWSVVGPPQSSARFSA